MNFARIDLSKTNYKLLTNFKLIENPDITQLNDIFVKYCRYKKFTSVMPIFEYQYTDKLIDILGYYHEDKLVAFTLVRKLDKYNVENCQFAWDYNEPKLSLGIESLKNECAFYKTQGYHYMYLGQADEYKSKLQGYEILGIL